MRAPSIRGRLTRLASRGALVSLALIDQGVVSAGSFAFNVLLARAIPLADYGRFAIVVGLLMLMQAGCGSVIFYPMSVRGAATDEAGRGRLIVSGQLLTVLVGVPLAAVLAALIGALVGGDLLLPSFAMFAANQIQESMRRGLIAEFRPGAAVPGDVLSYFGQVAVLFAAYERGGATLPAALWTLAATSAIAAVVQWFQLLPRGARPLPLQALLADFWSLGRWSLAGNALQILRVQCLPWLLTVMAGGVAAGQFQVTLNLVNATNPVVFSICNLVPQASSRALRFGRQAAWTAAWRLIIAGLLPVGGIVALIMASPDTTLDLLYGDRTDLDLIDAAVRVMALSALFYYLSATACAYLLGVGGGPDTLRMDGIITLGMVLASPMLVGTFGLDGACTALLFSQVARTVLLGSLVKTYAFQRTVAADRSPARSGGGPL